jgi:hypothetical protein
VIRGTEQYKDIIHTISGANLPRPGQIHAVTVPDEPDEPDEILPGSGLY